MEDLNKEQKAAVLCNEQHTMVLAGAGTGKTKTIIYKVCHLIKQGINPANIAILTFTRKAANEIIHRLKDTVEYGQATSIFSGTFHNFCFLNIRKYNSFFNLSKHKIIDQEDQKQLLKYAKENANITTTIKNAELLKIISYARNSNISIENYLEKIHLYDSDVKNDIINIFQEYQQQKAKMFYLDFDDILIIFAQQLKKNQTLRELIAKNYTQLLVDEMQDTNPIQWAILESLAPFCGLFCVGDDAQSIYMFRGADFRNIHKFVNNFSSTVLQLNENFRSTQEILDLTNWLLAESELPYNKQLVASRGKGLKPQIHDFFNEWEEADWITQQLKINYAKGYLWKEQMVLVRTSWNARTLEAALVTENIPYVFIGGVNLMSTAHVKDLLCLIQIAAYPNDRLAWLRYLCLWAGIGIKGAANNYQKISTLNSLDEIVTFLKTNIQNTRKLLTIFF